MMFKCGICREPTTPDHMHEVNNDRICSECFAKHKSINQGILGTWLVFCYHISHMYHNVNRFGTLSSDEFIFHNKEEAELGLKYHNESFKHD